jgi:hypothetical protein
MVQQQRKQGETASKDCHCRDWKWMNHFTFRGAMHFGFRVGSGIGATETASEVELKVKHSI